VYLIVGLGNPGDKYEHTRHNIGFLAADFLASKLSRSSSFESKFNSLFLGTVCHSQSSQNSRHENTENTILILKPQTFMNLSGEAVSLAVRFYKIPTENIIVLHDDIDLPFAKIKVKQGGGSGGHNGLKSIDSLIGNNYHRIRIGVGRPENPRFDVADFVLSNFSKEEQKELDFIFEEVKNQLSIILKHEF
jgi:PTH1 family peptidyl-tRNA hydrolase